MVSEDEVRRLCLGLPETAEKPFQGLPGFYVKGKCFARVRTKPEALVVFRPDVHEKEALMAAEPEKYFQTPHYAGHPAVLVRLEAIEAEELEELLRDSWALTAPARVLAASGIRKP